MKTGFAIKNKFPPDFNYRLFEIGFESMLRKFGIEFTVSIIEQNDSLAFHLEDVKSTKKITEKSYTI